MCHKLRYCRSRDCRVGYKYRHYYVSPQQAVSICYNTVKNQDFIICNLCDYKQTINKLLNESKKNFQNRSDLFFFKYVDPCTISIICSREKTKTKMWICKDAFVNSKYH